MLGYVPHVYVQCVTPSPVQRGDVGINESSEQNFVRNNIHASYLSWGLYYMYSEIGQKSGSRKKSKIYVVTKFNEAHHLFGVCTTYQCTLGYRQSSTYPMCDPQPGPKEPCRSKYGWVFTVEGCQAGHKSVIENA